MGHAVMKKPVNPNGLIPSQNTYAGDPSKIVRIQYLLIDENGSGDDVFYKSQVDALESLLGDKGIGEELLSLMNESGADISDDPFDVTVSDWFSDNFEDVMKLATEYGYRLIGVMK